MCTGQDLTDRKQTEYALHGSEERIRAILNTAADAIVTIDRRGTIVAVNPATERMFGYSRGELIGGNVNLLMPSPYREQHDGYLRHYLATGEAKIIGNGREVEGRRKDGTVFPIDLAVSEVADLGLFTGIIRDITERKAEHERLIQSERLATLGQAMASLAHESRNALARSQGNLSRLARRLKDNDELLQLIQGARRANEDIRRQFEEVREYAAPIQVRRDSVLLPVIVYSAWKELADDRQKRKATLTITGTEQDFTCEADSFLLRNAFRNLLENALAACDDPVEIEVGIREEQYGGVPALRLSIQDNGPGFLPDAAQRAFDAFFTTKAKGTGLGLAIVKRVVEAHGGVVAVESGIGGGAEVVVTLPRSQP